MVFIHGCDCTDMPGVPWNMTEGVRHPSNWTDVVPFLFALLCMVILLVTSVSCFNKHHCKLLASFWSSYVPESRDWADQNLN